MTLTKRGFTLVELLVVVGMIATLLGALTTSVAAAQERARIQKALSDVKVTTQAILASENFKQSGKYELKPMNRVDADASSLAFLLGKGGNDDSGERLPATLMASLQAGGKLLDPWGTPYKVTIKKGDAQVRIESAAGSMKTGYYLPNFYRLSEEERR